MPGYYLGIDQGTTLTTAVLVDENWHIVAKASKAHKQYYPQPGWVEHDPMEIYENCLAVTAMALSQLPGATAKDILCIGLDHQGETCLIWDRDTGVPIYNAIVWQDRRTAAQSDKLKQEMGGHILQITGSLPDAYHSATKLSWLLDHVEGARARAEKGELLAGTLNTWLYWKLTGGECYKTDPSSANCMMLMDIRKTEWNQELLDLMNIPSTMLPEMCDCNHVY